jgi:hypothetical protein
MSARQPDTALTSTQSANNLPVGLDNQSIIPSLLIHPLPHWLVHMYCQASFPEATPEYMWPAAQDGMPLQLKRAWLLA